MLDLLKVTFFTDCSMLNHHLNATIWENMSSIFQASSRVLFNSSLNFCEFLIHHFQRLPTVDRINPKQPPGMVLKPCKSWDKLPSNWLAGFLPSTVCSFWFEV